MRLIISPSARNDLIEITDFIAQDAPKRAQSFVEELYVACAELTRSPRRFAEIESSIPGLRRRVYGRYSIYYRIKGDELEIARIASSARDLHKLFPDD
jgi:plasmid stabilization system protein ParE